MVVPPAFDALLKINRETLPTNVTLKDYNEVIWKVKMERKGKDLIIGDGWKGFVSHHCLKDGDFILFKYDGSSQFDVHLYGINGLKKGKVKEYSKVNDVHVKDEPITEERPTDCEPIVASGSDGKNTETEPTDRRSEASSGSSGSKPSETLVRKPRERQGARAVSAVARQKASFVFKMTKAKRYVYVPLLVLKAHNIKMKEVMKLRDENGKFWPVHVKFLDNGQIYLTSGWLEFCRAKKLSVGDKCAFEFIIPEDKDSNVIQVQVVSRKQGAPTQEPASSGRNTSKQTENNVKKVVAGRRKSPRSVVKMNPISKDTIDDLIELNARKEEKTLICNRTCPNGLRRNACETAELLVLSFVSQMGDIGALNSSLKYSREAQEQA
ncbi:unnamed protein product [Dovyalis caffra]|uniref:TF-B3 domain-containing protein n=1 Tax=Dovyalis caffra TaxID=77055 RepID=A0AAV1RVW6_9ROSI|nr:unnamed protein product [Dovyalis caffra]